MMAVDSDMNKMTSNALFRQLKSFCRRFIEIFGGRFFDRSIIDITSEGCTLQKSNSCSLDPGFSVADLQLEFSEGERDSGVSASTSNEH